jgi:hypothetical protein
MYIRNLAKLHETISGIERTGYLPYSIIWNADNQEFGTVRRQPN